MGERRGEPPDRNHDPWFPRASASDVLGDRRRTVLSVLSAQSEPVSESTLAARVRAEERRSPPPDSADVALDHVLTELYHIHLPKLDAAGLISWHDGTVEARFEGWSDYRPQAARSVDRDTIWDRWEPKRDDVALRRHVVDVLGDVDRPIPLSELATALADHVDLSATGTVGDESADDGDRLLAVLHHVHLPMLDQTDVVRYDPDRKRVSLAGDAPVLDR
jgi:hypothetical protein